MRKRGAVFEDRVARYLRKKGFEILARNYSTRFGEIDIIAMERDTLVFVEVKGRERGEAEYFFSPSKAKRLYKTAMVYLASMGWLERPFRFDFVAVNESSLKHYRDVLGEGGIIVG